MRRQARGSALVIALLLMAAVSGVAFAIGRLFLLDANLAGMYEDSTVAYYGAESGIEEGMLRWRYDRNVELPGGSDTSVTRKYVKRVDLSLPKSLGIGDPTTPISNMSSMSSNPQTIFYDLNIKYKDPFFGNDLNGDYQISYSDFVNPQYEQGAGQALVSIKDEATKITLPVLGVAGDYSTSPILSVKVVNGAGSLNCDDLKNSAIEMRITGKPIGESQPKEYKALFALSPDYIQDVMAAFNSSAYDVVSFRAGYACSNYNDGSHYVYNRDYIQFVANYGYDQNGQIKRDLTNEYWDALKTINFDGPVTLSLKLLSKSNSVKYMALALFYPGYAQPNPPVLIATPFTTIKSTGYYGKVTRTLTSNIDRQSGTVYDLYDYVAYQHPSTP